MTMLKHSRWSGRLAMPQGPGWVPKGKSSVANCLVWYNTSENNNQSETNQSGGGFLREYKQNINKDNSRNPAIERRNPIIKHGKPTIERDKVYTRDDTQIILEKHYPLNNNNNDNKRTNISIKNTNDYQHDIRPSSVPPRLMSTGDVSRMVERLKSYVKQIEEKKGKANEYRDKNIAKWVEEKKVMANDVHDTKIAKWAEGRLKQEAGKIGGSVVFDRARQMTQRSIENHDNEFDNLNTFRSEISNNKWVEQCEKQSTFRQNTKRSIKNVTSRLISENNHAITDRQNGEETNRSISYQNDIELQITQRTNKEIEKQKTSYPNDTNKIVDKVSFKISESNFNGETMARLGNKEIQKQLILSSRNLLGNSNKINKNENRDLDVINKSNSEILDNNYHKFNPNNMNNLNNLAYYTATKSYQNYEKYDNNLKNIITKNQALNKSDNDFNIHNSSRRNESFHQKDIKCLRNDWTQTTDRSEKKTLLDKKFEKKHNIFTKNISQSKNQSKNLDMSSNNRLSKNDRELNSFHGLDLALRCITSRTKNGDDLFTLRLRNMKK